MASRTVSRLPVRRYQSFEVELNKNFSQGYLIRANYRFAKLWGNYEGLFRNDNGQSDPGISSLFDFTQGVVGLLGAQFTAGLPEHRSSQRWQPVRLVHGSEWILAQTDWWRRTAGHDRNPDLAAGIASRLPERR